MSPKSLDWARVGSVLPERNVSSPLITVGSIFCENSSKVLCCRTHRSGSRPIPRYSAPPRSAGRTIAPVSLRRIQQQDQTLLRPVVFEPAAGVRRQTQTRSSALMMSISNELGCEHGTMIASQWAGLGAGIALIAFILFAFHQGMKVKPDDDPKNPPTSSL